MHTRLLAIVSLIVVMLLAACGQGGGQTDEPGASASEGDAVDAETVSVGAALGQMRGHFRVASELSAAGDTEGTITHAAHPASELMSVVRGELDEHDADPDALEAALSAVTDAAAAGDDAAVQAAIETAISATHTAEEAFVGEAATDAAYVGSVVAQLLTTAGHEYGEAVVDGELVQEVEYQDAYGFVTEARALYDQISDDVEAAAAEEAAEIEEAFETLSAALPGPEAPSELAAIEDIESAAALVGHELEETVGALAVTDSDPEAVAEEINRLLDEIVALVEEGDREAAAELAAEAYLENYEVIEAGVIEAAPEVNEELEPLLGAELRRQIEEGASPAEIREMVDRARELLAQGVEALPEGH